MSRSRDLANLANNATGLETLTVSDITDLTATATELNYVSGAGSAIQTQINGKIGASDTFNGTIGSSATITSGINMPDFTYNLSVGSHRTITISANQIIVYGAVNTNGTGTGSGNSAGLGVYGPGSSSGSPKAQSMTGDLSKTGDYRADTGRFITIENSLYVKDRIQGYFGDGGNNAGAGTLSPGVNRWSAQFDSSDDYELKAATADAGVFYFWLNIILD